MAARRCANVTMSAPHRARADQGRVDGRQEYGVDTRPIRGVQTGNHRGELTHLGVRVDDEPHAGPDALHFRLERLDRPAVRRR